VRLLVEESVRKVVLGRFDVLARGLLVADRTGLTALEDVLFALGEMGKYLRRQIKVLGNYRLGSVSYSSS